MTQYVDVGYIVGVRLSNRGKPCPFVRRSDKPFPGLVLGHKSFFGKSADAQAEADRMLREALKLHRMPTRYTPGGTEWLAKRVYVVGLRPTNGLVVGFTRRIKNMGCRIPDNASHTEIARGTVSAVQDRMRELVERHGANLSPSDPGRMGELPFERSAPPFVQVSEVFGPPPEKTGAVINKQSGRWEVPSRLVLRRIDGKE